MMIKSKLWEKDTLSHTKLKDSTLSSSMSVFLLGDVANILQFLLCLEGC